MQRTFLGLILAGAMILGGFSTAQAQGAALQFPVKQVELVVPFSAGGSTDVIARFVGQILGESWGRPVIVLNKAGATGAIGSEYVARAAPDGYTLLLASASTHAVLPAYRSDLPYDSVNSFAPVTLLATFPNMLVVNPKKVPVNNVDEFIRFLKANPGKLNFGSTGLGGSPHFTAELFKLMTKTEMTHVPYKGGAPALSDLIGGNVDLTFDNMATVWQQVQQGNLRALGVTSLQRTSLAPEVPAIAETLPGFDATSWICVLAPAGTPSAIIENISRAFAVVLRRADVVKRLNELGATPAFNEPAELAEFIGKERAKWQRVAREANISAQ